MLESLYDDALCSELELRNIAYRRQVEYPVQYKPRMLRKFVLDLVVEDNVVVELKSLPSVPDVCMAQVLTYLRITGLRKALLINCGGERLVDGVQRISL